MNTHYSSFFIIAFFLLHSISSQLNAQISKEIAPQSFSKNFNSVQKIPETSIPVPNLDSLKEIDKEEDKYKDIPWRFGFPVEVNLNTGNSGNWITLSNGDRLWRLTISSKGATSLNLNYDKFFLPKGATFHLYDKRKEQVLGAFTSFNNKADSLFATSLIYDDQVILEYYEPKNKTGEGVISISSVVYGYRSMEKKLKNFGASGNCNRNVICDSLKWGIESRSVVMLLTMSNSRFCSGALVNNVRQDGTPYILTAEHCSPSTSNVFMFNYKSPSCTPDIDGPTNQTVTGATIRAQNTISDFILLELSNSPPASYNVFYAGWSADTLASSQSSGIHHPNGDVMKISHDKNEAISSGYYSQGNDHWKVANWETGTTESGSSGSVLFDQFHRVVGQLHGGNAACNNKLEDYYGKFSTSWEPDPDSSKQLKYWLDPDTTGELVLNGWLPNGASKQTNAALLNFDNFSKFICTDSLAPAVIIRNQGSDTLFNGDIYYSLDNNPYQSLSWSDTLLPFQTTTETIPYFNLGSGFHSFKVYSDSPNGVIDDFPANDTIQKDFITAASPNQNITLTFKSDDYGSENYWTLHSNSGTILHSGGPYFQKTGGDTYIEPMCLSDGCYRFIMYDTFGDGICCSTNYGSGYYLITDDMTGDTLHYRDTINDPFQSSADTVYFCLGDSCNLFLDANITHSASSVDNGSIDLQVLGGFNLSYNWSTGDTTQDLQNIPAGTYTVHVTDTTGCSDSLTVTVGLTNISGSSQYEEEILVYPNPVRDKLHISVKGPVTQEYPVELFDMTGRKVLEKTLPPSSRGEHNTLNLNGIRKGIYLLNIRTAKGFQSFKIIVEG